MRMRPVDEIEEHAVLEAYYKRWNSKRKLMIIPTAVCAILCAVWIYVEVNIYGWSILYGIVGTVFMTIFAGCMIDTWCKLWAIHPDKVVEVVKKEDEGDN